MLYSYLCLNKTIHCYPSRICFRDCKAKSGIFISALIMVEGKLDCRVVFFNNIVYLSILEDWDSLRAVGSLIWLMDIAINRRVCVTSRP